LKKNVSTDDKAKNRSRPGLLPPKRADNPTANGIKKTILPAPGKTVKKPAKEAEAPDDDGEEEEKDEKEDTEGKGDSDEENSDSDQKKEVEVSSL
jgi:hypothetical protein